MLHYFGTFHFHSENPQQDIFFINKSCIVSNVFFFRCQNIVLCVHVHVRASSVDSIHNDIVDVMRKDHLSDGYEEETGFMMINACHAAKCCFHFRLKGVGPGEFRP